MATDILLNNDSGYLDISFTDGDLTLTHGFETALLMSILCEARAAASEVPTVERRRGWWGNYVSSFQGYEQGSKFWLLYQAKRTNDTLNLAKTYVSNGLQWFLTDKYADDISIDTSFDNIGLKIDTTLYRSKNKIANASYRIWDNTNRVDL